MYAPLFISSWESEFFMPETDDVAFHRGRKAMLGQKAVCLYLKSKKMIKNRI